MKTRLMYVELKSGYGDSGPAWIGRVSFSKSGRTVYFNNRALQRFMGIAGNHQDLETGEEYWISGVKKNGGDRHWAGSGKIMIDRNMIPEYLEITGQDALDHRRFEIVDIADEYPVERIYEHENQKDEKIDEVPSPLPRPLALTRRRSARAGVPGREY